jgi:DNA-binding transcriptional LysR family regulator
VNLTLFEAFRVTMQTGTISAAAETLGRSQPAVSRMLDRLEAELGIKLFERRKGRVVPTQQAHVLVDEIERAFVSLSSLSDFARRLREGEEAGISIAALPALGLDFMPEVVARFRALRPSARVILNVRMSVSVEAWVAAQQVDLGFAETPFRRSGFETRIFADSHYVAAIPAGHALAGREVVHPADLRGEALISWTAFVSARRMLDDILQGAGVAVRAIYESTMSATMCSMVRLGLGIALVDPFTAWAQRDPSLVYRPLRPALPCRFAQLIPEMRQPIEVTRDFLGCAEEERDRVLAEIEV